MYRNIIVVCVSHVVHTLCMSFGSIFQFFWVSFKSNEKRKEPIQNFIWCSYFISFNDGGHTLPYDIGCVCVCVGGSDVYVCG
eukprot:m.22160 g.22160  ORF g.22160 m.22160 type:complete len:82 (-) comp13703_c0_seq1:1494-1739(-)